MRLVDRPYAKPHRCAALPFVGQMTPTRWIDTGSELDGFDNHVYLSEQAVTEAARLLGWVPGGELRAAQVAVEVTQLALTEAQAELAEMRAAWDAVDVIERHGMTARAKVPA